MALSQMEMAVEVYIKHPHKIQLLHTFEPTQSDRVDELNETDVVQNVTVRHFGGTDMSTRWNRFY